MPKLCSFLCELVVTEETLHMYQEIYRREKVLCALREILIVIGIRTGREISLWDFRENL